MKKLHGKTKPQIGLTAHSITFDKLNDFPEKSFGHLNFQIPCCWTWHRFVQRAFQEFADEDGREQG